MKEFNISITLLAIAFFAIATASAETGDIPLNTHEIYGFYQFGVTDGTGTSSINFSVFNFYSTGYETIVNMTAQSDYFTFTNASNYTHFTITSGGTGDGYASYSKVLGKLSWNFAPGTIINNNVLVLSYDSPIFNEVALGGSFILTAEAVSPTKPVCISQTGKCLQARAGGQPYHIIDYGVDVSSSFNTHYVINYPLSGFFSAAVTKTGTNISSLICINSSTVSYVCQTEVSLTPLYYYGGQLDGIYINVSHSGGNYNNFLVNSSGIAVHTPVPPGAGGSTNGQIQYDYSSATLGTTYGVNVSISDANFSSYTTYKLRIYDTSGLQVEGSPIEFSTQNYNTSRMWKFVFPGLYSSNLSSCAIWACLIGLETQMDSASLLVTEQPFAYNVSTDKTSYTNGDTINISVKNPSSNVIYLGMFLQVGGMTGIMDYPVPGNTNLSILQPVGNDMTSGNWETALYTSLGARGKVANYVFTIGMPSVTENRLGLRWGDQYFFGRSNALYYKSNFNTSTVKVYKVFPGQKNNSLFDTFTVAANTSSQKSYLMDSMGTWNASITDSGNASNITHANMTVLGNTSTDCSKSTPSYICFDKRNYVAGDPFTINMRVSDPPIIVLNDYNWVVFDSNNKVVYNGTIIKFWECCFSINFPYAITTNHIWKPSASGRYHAVLYYGGNPAILYSDGTVLADDFALVTSPPVGETITLPGAGVSSVNAWSSHILSLLGSMFFWGLMLLLGFAITVYSGKFPIKTRPDLATMGFAFIETIGGLFAPYTIPVLVILVVIFALMFRVGPKVIGEE